jgi:hypothetical protein
MASLANKKKNILRRINILPSHTHPKQTNKQKIEA